MTATSSTEIEATPQVPSVTRVEWAPIARVNLLPREISERRRFRRVQQGLALVVVVTLCGAGAAVWWSEREVTDAQRELDTVQARTADLQRQKDAFADVPKTTAQVRAAEEARATAMANDIPWYRYLGDLSSAAPDDVSFTTVTMTVPGVASAAQGAAVQGASNDPFAPTNGLGAVTIEGISGDYPDVAQWMDNLDDVAGLDVSTLANATAKEDGSGISFSSGITVTQDALSHRYDRKAS
jgi:Tfp pilus assembly protein PilN